MSRYTQIPKTEQEFEQFCLKLLRKHWANPNLQLYANRGEPQCGVDIHDPTVSSPVKAAQCKHHDPRMTITPSEIQAEIKKAYSFTPQLSTYLILTTAKPSKQADDAVMVINAAHKATNQFTVLLWTWNRIEDVLEDHPEIAKLLSPISDAQAKHISDQVLEVKEVVQASSTLLVETFSRQTNSTTDSELDAAEKALASHEIEEAIATLRRIERQNFASLSQEQKYRLQVGFANVAIAKGEHEEAGRQLLAAAKILPNAERARSNEALGHELVGQRRKAYELAVELSSEFPLSTKLTAVRIRNAPDGISFDELERDMDGATAKDVEVCLAFAMRAMREGRFSEAERYARRAVDASPSLFQARTLLGQALLNQEAVKFERSIWSEPFSLDRHRIDACVATMDESINLARSYNATWSLPDSYLIRAQAKVLLQDISGAEDDFVSAVQADPKYGHAYRRHAHFLMSRGRTDEAIATLERNVRLAPDANSEFFLAGLLSGQDGVEARRRATDIFMKLAADDKDVPDAAGTASGISQSIQSSAFHSAIDDLVQAERLDDAECLVSNASPAHVNELGRLTASSRIQSARGDSTSASLFADRALGLVDEASYPLDLRNLASQLENLERHGDALPLWTRLAKSSGYGLDTRRLVECAERVKRFDVVLDVAEAARKSHVFDTWLFYKEIDTLESFDLDKAVALLKEEAKRSPDDKRIQLNLSYLGLKWHKPELVDPRADAYPAVEEVGSDEGALVVSILREHGELHDALRYAYDLWRLHPDKASANASLCSIFYTPGSQSPQLETPTEVVPGVAVRFTEYESVDRWVVIEDSSKPRPATCEISPSSELARALMGKRLGDQVIIATSSARSRTAVVTEITSKYLFVIHDIWQNWQLRFPDDSYIQTFNTLTKDPETGDPVSDFTDLKIIADDQMAHRTSVEAFYLSRPLPIGAFARQLGRLPFLATCYLALNPSLSIRSNYGNDEERTTSLGLLDEQPTLILDVTALAMVFLLNLEEPLRKWPGELVVSRHTELELLKVQVELANSLGTQARYGKTDRGYFLHTVSPEVAQNQHDSFSSFLDFVKDRFEIRSCPETAAMDPVFREQLDGVFGRHGVESIMLSRRAGHVLWSEDRPFADIAKSEFGVRRIWTQVWTIKAADTEILTPDGYLRANATLLGFDVQATLFNSLAVAKAGELAKWDVNVMPFKQALEQTLICPDDLATLASISTIINNIYYSTILPVARSADVMSVLAKVSGYPRGLRIIRMLPQALFHSFGRDVAGANAMSGLVLAWLATRRS